MKMAIKLCSFFLFAFVCRFICAELNRVQRQAEPSAQPNPSAHPSRQRNHHVHEHDTLVYSSTYLALNTELNAKGAQNAELKIDTENIVCAGRVVVCGHWLSENPHK